MTRRRKVSVSRANALLRTLEAGVETPSDRLRLLAALERSLDRVRRLAGDVEPWTKRLAAECERTSIAEVAQRLDISRTTVSLVLSGRYKSSVRGIQARVEQLLPKSAAPKFDSAMHRSAACWGEDRPAWVARLADACDRDSQSEVGRVLGVSGSVINQVLGNRYRGDMERVQAWAEALYPETPAVVPVVRCKFLLSLPDLPGVERCDDVARVECLRTQEEPIADQFGLAWRQHCTECNHALSKVRGRVVRITKELR